MKQNSKDQRIVFVMGGDMKKVMEICGKIPRAKIEQFKRGEISLKKRRKIRTLLIFNRG